MRTGISDSSCNETRPACAAALVFTLCQTIRTASLQVSMPDSEDPGLIATSSSQSPQQVLAALLEQHAPARLLHVGLSDLPAIEAFSRSHSDSQIDRAPTPPLPKELASRRYDLALVADCLEHLPKRDGLRQTARRSAICSDGGAPRCGNPRRET